MKYIGKKVLPMTIDNFIKTIKKSGKMKISLKKLSLDIFSSLNLTQSEETADKWRKTNTSPNDISEIDPDGFIDYFETKTKSTWKSIQEAFGEIDKKNNFINRNTSDVKIFFRSLLTLFYETLRIDYVSLRQILPPEPTIYGRREEMAQIEDIFEKHNFALLTGIGGIGKSYMASAYAHKLWESGGWTVQHIICEDSDTLRNSVNKLQFDILTEKSKTKVETNQDIFNQKVDILKKIFKPTLIILDNLNKPFTPSDWDDFKKLTNCGHHIQVLITSRHKWLHDSQNIVDILPLDNDALYDLYAHHRFEDSSDHSKYITEHEDVLNKLFALVENHTLMVTLLAKLPNSILADEQEIYNRLEMDLNLPTEKATVRKDGVEIEGNVMEIAKRIFDISQLTDEEKTIMGYMSIMPLMGIEFELFEELTDYTSNKINRLIRNHWIIRNEETFWIRLHPLISETIINSIISEKNQNRDKNNAAEFMNRVYKNEFFTRIITMRKEGDGDPIKNLKWHTLNKICASYVSKIAFPLMYYSPIIIFENGNFFDFVIDEYKDAFISINQIIKKYANSDISTDDSQMEND